jgi:hypothetical protein
MAVRMAVEQTASAEMTQAMPADCPMMAQSSSQEEGTVGAGHCLACQLCAAFASLPEVAAEAGPAPTAAPLASPVVFRSAELPRDLRPPIS